MRIGLFGGTFDPPHVGHLMLAEWARERLSLDRVLFVPAGQPPHKSRTRVSAAAARLAMTRLAVRGHPAFEVSAAELAGEGPSFTLDTVRAFVARAPRARFFLLMGADSLDDFHRWREPQRILALATLAVGGRPGAAGPGGRLGSGRVVWLGNPGIDVSSSVIRQRARAGRSLRYLVPDAVARYIARHRLYRARPSGGVGARAGAYARAPRARRA